MCAQDTGTREPHRELSSDNEILNSLNIKSKVRHLCHFIKSIQHLSSHISWCSPFFSGSVIKHKDLGNIEERT